jgi:uncharacterized protein
MTSVNFVSVTPIYAALLGLFFVGISLWVICLRLSFKLGFGDGGHPRLIRAVRVHANFAEYVPLGLVLLFLAEAKSGPIAVIHVIGALLLLGRIVHLMGLLRGAGTGWFRALGMLATLTSLLIASVLLVGLFK